MKVEAPRIVTELPGPRAKALLKREKALISPSLTPQVPVVWDRAEGALVYDIDGNLFIDFTSGVLVTNTGHCHPRVAKAIAEQAKRLLNCYDFSHPTRVRLLEKLREILPKGLERVLFLTTGSEATDASIKIARRYTGRHEIVSFHGAFHGRTYAAMTVGGKIGVKKGYGPLLPGVIQAPYPYCYRCPFNLKYPECGLLCVDYLDWVLRCQSTGDTAAVIVEPYEGAAGCLIPPKEFLPRLRRFCDDHGFLLIVDEVQSSFGRTGKMFAVQHYDVTPDILYAAKGLASGVPTAMVAAKEAVMNALEPGSMSSTYGGNPLSCAAAIASIDVILEEKLIERAAEIGSYVIGKLGEIKEKRRYLGDVRGLGLAIGIELVKDKRTKVPAPEDTQRFVNEAYKKGLILIAPLGHFNNVVRVVPPLTINRELVDKGLDIIDDTLKLLEN